MRERVAPEIKSDEVFPVGAGFSFQVYKTETPTDLVSRILPQVTADLEKSKPGFRKWEERDKCIVAMFGLPVKEDVDVLREGIESVLEVPKLKKATFIFIEGINRMLVSGDSAAIKQGIQLLLPYMNIAGKQIKLDQSKMVEVHEQATIVKNIKFKNIPDAEVETCTLSGEIEDVYASKMDLRDSEMASFTGVFSNGRSIKIAKTGKCSILKSKREAINRELLSFVVAVIDG